MTDTRQTPNRPDVAIIGAGPAGLAAATALKAAGVRHVVVLEREQDAGGIPRSCGHFPFGMREFKRVLKGPAYAARLVTQALDVGVDIRTGTTVTEIHPGGTVSFVSSKGTGRITADRVIYATGVRESTRAARLISGVRTQGVMNTGALQSMIYLKHRRPFRNPVIIGSELVSFSALMTCRHAGIRPVAMIEAANKVIARWPSSLFPRLHGVPLLTGMRLTSINGPTQVEDVELVDQHGKPKKVRCDGVILTGAFLPESALGRCGHLVIDPGTGGPQVDQWGRCSDPAYFACGNILRPVETAGRSWAEGCRTGKWVAKDLVGALPPPEKSLCVSTGDSRLKYAMPQRLVPSPLARGMSEIQMRVTESVSGNLVARTKGKTIWTRPLNSSPERRLNIPIDAIIPKLTNENATLEIDIQEY